MSRQQPKPAVPPPAAPLQVPQCAGLTQAQVDEVVRVVTERLLEAEKPLVDDAVQRVAAEVVRLIDMPAVLERVVASAADRVLRSYESALRTMVCPPMVDVPSRFMLYAEEPSTSAQEGTSSLAQTEPPPPDPPPQAEPFWVRFWCDRFRFPFVSDVDQFVLSEVFESAVRFVASVPPYSTDREHAEGVYGELLDRFIEDDAVRVKSPKQFLLKHSSYMSSLRWTP